VRARLGMRDGGAERRPAGRPAKEASMGMYVCDQYGHVGKETSRERVGRSSQGGVPSRDRGGP
jgi:hypothetical protein